MKYLSNTKIKTDKLLKFYVSHHDYELVKADFGPPFPDDINSYQAIIGANYLFIKTFMIMLGYRTYPMDFPKEEAIFNGTFKGWIMKISFQF